MGVKESNRRFPSPSTGKAVLAIAVVSALLGSLLVLASIILLVELGPRIEKCYDPRGSSGCHPLYVDTGVSALGILLGIFQLIILAVSLCRRATCSPHSILASQFVTFILSIILFSLAVYYDESLLISTLTVGSQAIHSKFMCFYAATGINWIFSFFAVIFANRCL